MSYSSPLFQCQQVLAVMAALTLGAPMTTMAQPITDSTAVVTESETPSSTSSSSTSSSSTSSSSSRRLHQPIQPSEAPPPAPHNPPPNQTQPGGGLDASVKSCNSADLPLTALVPVANPVFTASAHPTFLFYLPDEPEVIDYAEFIVLSADEKEQVYAAQFMPTRPGIISVSMPTEATYALDVDQAYHWYLSVHCQNAPSALTATVLTVDGWVQRISPTLGMTSMQAISQPSTEQITEQATEQAIEPTVAQTTTQAAEPALPALWYDAIAEIAESLASNSQPNSAQPSAQSSPQSSAQPSAQQQAQWTSWLTAIGLGAIADQPVVGPVLLQSADTSQANNLQINNPQANNPQVTLPPVTY